MSATPPVIVHVYGCTDVGRTREHNEDAFAVADLDTASPFSFPAERTETPGERGTLFMVADGMGGAAAGEIASSMAVDVVLGELRSIWVRSPKTDPLTFARALVAATATANTRIHRFATEHLEYRGMGTTATVAGILGDTLYIAQVGDSRAYLVRGGTAWQLTKDQSLMQRLIEAGEITAEEAEVSERRNIILQALGPESTVKVDITSQPLRRGDTLVLCSDGLSGLVRDTEIARLVTEEPDLRKVCTQLVDEANARGGPDNITVVAARFEGPGLPMPAPDEAIGHRVFPLGDEALAEGQAATSDLPPERPPEEPPTKPMKPRGAGATDAGAVVAGVGPSGPWRRLARVLVVAALVAVVAALVLIALGRR